MIDFKALQAAGVKAAIEKGKEAEQDAVYYMERAEELSRWAHRADMNQPYIEYRPNEEWPDKQCAVYIPAFALNHFDGDAIAAPFGTTYWPTWEEAKDFFDRVLADIEAGKYGEGWTA